MSKHRPSVIVAEAPRGTSIEEAVRSAISEAIADYCEANPDDNGPDYYTLTEFIVAVDISDRLNHSYQKQQRKLREWDESFTGIDTVEIQTGEDDSQSHDIEWQATIRDGDSKLGEWNEGTFLMFDVEES